MIRLRIAPSTPARMADLLWQLDCRIGLSPVGKRYVVRRPEGRVSINAQSRGRRLLLRWFASAHTEAAVATERPGRGSYAVAWLILTGSRLSVTSVYLAMMQQHKDQS